MTVVGLCTLIYLAAFQGCAWPGIVRMVRRGSSADLSIWREVLLLIGVSAQFTVMRLTGARWQVFVSPLCSGVSVLVMLSVILWFRRVKGGRS